MFILKLSVITLAKDHLKYELDGVGDRSGKIDEVNVLLDFSEFDSKALWGLDLDFNALKLNEPIIINS